MGVAVDTSAETRASCQKRSNAREPYNAFERASSTDVDEASDEDRIFQEERLESLRAAMLGVFGSGDGRAQEWHGSRHKACVQGDTAGLNSLHRDAMRGQSETADGMDFL